MKLAVLFGGQSHEHPVSLMSVTSIINNLNPEYEPYLVGITRDGRWYHYTGPVEAIIDSSWEKDPDNEEVILSCSMAHKGFYVINKGQFDGVDAVFPVLHGRGGEDGTIQGLCQLSGIPCVSCNLTSSAIAMDKEFTHIVAEAAGIKMARYKVLHRSENPNLAKIFHETVREIELPWYVKPSKEGSSFGAHKVTDLDSFIRYANDAFSYDEKILLEEFIDGTEVGCGILGRDRTGDVYEVVVETEMYGYAEKYDGYKTNIYVPAKNLTREQRDEVNRLGLKVAKALDIDCLGRADFFNSSKGLIFNEINLIPGFTSHSLYPAMFTAIGVSYSELIDELIDITMKEAAENEQK